MEDDYYSIESILAENQKIQCTFKVDVPGMGHLDGGNERDVCTTLPLESIQRHDGYKEQIKASNKMQIPMWMAYILIYSCADPSLLSLTPRIF